MSQVKDKLVNSFSKIGVKLSKHSPEILIGVGITSGVVATVLACNATLKVEDILDDAKDKLEKVEKALEKEAQILENSEHNDSKLTIVYSKDDALKDKTIIYTQTFVNLLKVYSPAIGVGALSVACILGAYNVLNKRNIALVAAYNLLEKSYSDYRGRVVAKFGEEVDKQLRCNATEKKINISGKNSKDEEKKKVNVVDGPLEHSDYARFFDEASPNWQDSAMHNLTFLKSQQQYANDLLHSRGHLFLNEVYDMLGIPRCSAGTVVGWIDDDKGDGFVDFGIYDKLYRPKRDFVNGYEKVILLDFNVDGLIWDKI